MTDIEVYARAIVSGHGDGALAYLTERVASFEAEGLHDDAEFWSLVGIEAQRQLAAAGVEATIRWQSRSLQHPET